MVKTLLARYDVQRDPDDSEGNTPLLLSAWLGNLPLLEIFLDIPWITRWHKNNNGKTTLALAAQEGHVEVVKRLLDPRLGPAYYVFDGAITAVNCWGPKRWYFDGDGWVRREDSALEAVSGRREESLKLILHAYRELGLY